VVAWLKKLFRRAPPPPPPSEQPRAHWTPFVFSGIAACGVEDPEHRAADPVSFLGMTWACGDCRGRARRAVLRKIALTR